MEPATLRRRTELRWTDLHASRLLCRFLASSLPRSLLHLLTPLLAPQYQQEDEDEAYFESEDDDNDADTIPNPSLSSLNPPGRADSPSDDGPSVRQASGSGQGSQSSEEPGAAQSPMEEDEPSGGSGAAGRSTPIPPAGPAGAMGGVGAFGGMPASPEDTFKPRPTSPPAPSATSPTGDKRLGGMFDIQHSFRPGALPCLPACLSTFLPSFRLSLSCVSPPLLTSHSLRMRWQEAAAQGHPRAG